MKRKVFRKLMAVSMATAMTVGLAGCGGGAGNESSQPSGNGGEQTPGTEQQPSGSGDEQTPSGSDESSQAEEGLTTIKIDPTTGEPFAAWRSS